MATRIFSSELEKEDDILLDFRDDMEHQEWKVLSGSVLFFALFPLFIIRAMVENKLEERKKKKAKDETISSSDRGSRS